MKIKDKDLKELRRIQDSIPKELSSRLVVKRLVTPTMAKALSLALHDKNLDPKVRERMQNIWDSGVLHQKEDVVNESVQKKIDKYVSSEIEKSIAAGRLTKKPTNHAS